MSEQETNEPKINWSAVANLSDVVITLAEQLKDGARDCNSKVFGDLLESYAEAPAEDGTLGIMFIKAGVDERNDDKRNDLVSEKVQEIAKTSPVVPAEDDEDENPTSVFDKLLKGFAPTEDGSDSQEKLADKKQGLALVKAAVAGQGVEAQATKEALVAAFEAEHFPAELELVPVELEAEPVAVVADAASVKEVAPAAVTSAISDLQKEFRAVAVNQAKQQELIRAQAAQIRDQAALIAKQADRITALETGRKEDHAAVTEIGESVIELSGVVQANAKTAAENIVNVITLVDELDATVKGKKAENEKENLRRFPRPNLGN